MPTLPQVGINKLENLGAVPIQVIEGSFVGDDVRSAIGSIKSSVKSGNRGSVRKGDDMQSVLSAVFSAKGGKTPDARSMVSSNKTTQSVINLRKRQHLRSALVSKLLDKYHPGIANSKTEQLINSEIDRLLVVGVVSEEDLRETEAAVRRQSNDEIAAIATNPFKRILAHKSGETDDWAKLHKKKLMEGMEADANKQELMRRQKADFRRQLAEQVNAVEAQKIAAKDEKLRDAAQVKRDVQEYLSEKERSRQEKLEHFRKIREERQEEMDMVKQRRAKAKEDKRSEERALMAQLRESQKEELERQKERKNTEMERAKRWKAENEAHLAEKERLRQIQQQKDWELQKKAIKVADEKEARRVKELAELKAKMKAREQQYRLYGESMAKQAREDEERMLGMQREAKEKADREHEARVAREREKKVAVRACLDQQMQDQEVRRSAEKSKLEEQSKVWKQQAMAAVMEADRKEQAKRVAAEEYRVQLEDQLRMEVKQRPGRELRMSDTERQLNRDDL